MRAFWQAKTACFQAWVVYLLKKASNPIKSFSAEFLFMVLGVDLGASSADFVLMKKKRILGKKSIQPIALKQLPKAISGTGFDAAKLEVIAVTGGRSASALNKYGGIPVTKVGEIRAIGAGGLFLSGKRKAIVASLGTGTCIVEARSGKFRHCTGIGVSGGTLLGLSKRLLGTASWSEVNRLAGKGSLKRVDLLVKDIVGRGIGQLPGNATASNFAMQGKASRADIALGIINLVAEVNAAIIALAVSACGQKRIVLTGKLLAVPLVRKRLLAGLKMLGVKAIVPKNYGVATAVGACVVASDWV